MDGMPAEVSFEPPPAHFASFLVGEPKAFPFVFWQRLPSVTRLLVASAEDKGESESMMVQERENEKKATEEMMEIRTKDGGHRIKNAQKDTQKKIAGKAVALVSLNKN
jgi:hypothetical protein